MGGVVPSLFERQSGDGRITDGACFSSHHLLGVAVSKIGRGVTAGLGIEVLANGETKSLVVRLRSGAFVTGPAEISHSGRKGLGIRLISSLLLQPTLAIQSSLVPGLIVNRNGLRNP